MRRLLTGHSAQPYPANGSILGQRREKIIKEKEINLLEG
jgi:hypothetical protein